LGDVGQLAFVQQPAGDGHEAVVLAGDVRSVEFEEPWAKLRYGAVSVLAGGICLSCT
jgi:hypothetical protein